MIPCPSCGAGLRFDIASQKMVCDYCRNSYDVPSINDDSLSNDAKGEQTYDSYVYVCPSCGAELVTTDKADAIGFCQYCGGASMLFDKLRREWRPDGVIPFKITKEQCKEAYLKEVKRHPFVSKKYRDPKLLDEFRGVYMPYWSYKAAMQGEFKLTGTGPRRMTGVNTYEIKHYHLKGATDYRLEGYSHDASATFDDDLSESLAPYDAKQQLGFHPGYLSGFYAETGNVDPHEYDEAITEEMKEDAARVIESDPQVAETVKKQKLTMDYAKSEAPVFITDARRALYPVWFMSRRSGNEITYAAVNGQTGRVSADLPLSPAKILITAGCIAAGLFGVLALIMGFLPAIKANTTLALCLLLMLTGMYYLKRAFIKSVDKQSKVGGVFYGFITVLSFLALIGFTSDGSYDGDMRFFCALVLIPALIILLMSNIRLAMEYDKIKKKKFGSVSPLRQRILEEAKAFSKRTVWLTLLMWGMIIGGGLVVYYDPPYNIISYLLCFLAAAALFGLALFHIDFQTKVARRPLPQFNKKGAYYDENKG